MQSEAGAYIELYVKDEDNVEGVNSLELSDAVKIDELAVDNTSSDWKEISISLLAKKLPEYMIYILYSKEIMLSLLPKKTRLQ